MTKKEKVRVPTELPKFQYGDRVQVTSDGEIREWQGILTYFYDRKLGVVKSILQYPEIESYGYEVELDDGKKVIMKEKELKKAGSNHPSVTTADYSSQV